MMVARNRQNVVESQGEVVEKGERGQPLATQIPHMSTIGQVNSEQSDTIHDMHFMTLRSSASVTLVLSPCYGSIGLVVAHDGLSGSSRRRMIEEWSRLMVWVEITLPPRPWDIRM